MLGSTILMTISFRLLSMYLFLISTMLSSSNAYTHSTFSRITSFFFYRTYGRIYGNHFVSHFSSNESICNHNALFSLPLPPCGFLLALVIVTLHRLFGLLIVYPNWAVGSFSITVVVYATLLCSGFDATKRKSRRR